MNILIIRNAEKCPVCNYIGEPVKRVTVESLVKDENRKEVAAGNYFLCISKNCDVVYYNLDKNILRFQISYD